MATAINTTNVVTQDQLDKVSRVYDFNAKQYICLVENSKGEFDADGHKIEYTVRYLKGKGLTCTCKAGQEAKNCWHKRVAVAYCQALRQEQAEQGQIERYIAQGIDRETATRVVYAKGTVPTDYEVRQADAMAARREFSLLKK